MTVIGALAVNAVVRTGGLARGTQTFRTEVGSLTSFALGAGPAIAALGVAGAYAAARLVASQGAIADSLDLASRRIGTNVEDLSRYQYAAQLASDVTGDALSSALQRMNTNVGMAEQGLGKARKSLNELGLSASYLMSVDLDSRMGLIADAIAGVSDTAARTRLTEKIFGTGELVTMLDKGRAGLRALADESDRTGSTISELANEKLAAADNSIDVMSKSVAGAKHALAGLFAPALKTVADELTINIAHLRGINPFMKHNVTLAELQAAAHERLANKLQLAKDRQVALGKAQTEARMAAARREYEELQSERAGLSSQIDQTRIGNQTFGMSDVERAKDDRAHRVVDKALQDELIRELEIREKLEKTHERSIIAKERDQALQERAAQLIKAQITPLERYQSQLDEITRLVESGKLDPTQAARSVGLASRDYKAGLDSGAAPEQQRSNALVKFGSADAYRAIRESRAADRPKKIEERMLKETERGNKLAERTIAAIAKISVGKVANWN